MEVCDQKHTRGACQQPHTSELKAIYCRQNSGESARSITKLLGRHHTTDIREIIRNRSRYYTYFDEIAVEEAAQSRSIIRYEKMRSSIKLYS